MASSLKLAAIVAVYNENDFLDQFLMHYSPECDAIFVLDNESTPTPASAIIKAFIEDRLTNHPPIFVEQFSTEGKFDTARKQAELMRKKNEAIGKFDYVMVLDCDEFVVPKAGGRIKDHLGKEGVYATQGWNMYCYPGDLPYDPLIPLTQQRKRGVENRHYSKPIIVQPEFRANYSPGCHYIHGLDQVSPPDQAIFNLLHYRGYDEEVYVRRSLERATRIDVANPVDGGYAGGYYWGGDGGSFRAKYEYERNAGQITQVIP